MPLLNYTSSIDADKTAMEIAKCLSLHGAQAVLTEYDPKEGIVSAISFRINLDGRMISFRLPCDWRPVYEVIVRDFPIRPVRTKGSKAEIDKSVKIRAAKISEVEMQAVRTAWRIVKNWVEAQMALVETNMAKTQEVFLPYAVMKDGKTLAEKITADPSFLLGPGN